MSALFAKTRELEEAYDGSDSDTGDWYTLEVPPFFCAGCGETWKYPHWSNGLIVWPGENDPNLLKIQEVGKIAHDTNTTIKPYERSMGKPFSYYNLPPELQERMKRP